METALQEHLKGLTYESLLQLYVDSVNLDETGVLPMDAPLRELSHTVFQEVFVLHMSMIGREVYKELARRYVELQTSMEEYSKKADEIMAARFGINWRDLDEDQMIESLK